MKLLQSLLLVLGIVLFIHSAFSASTHVKVMRISQLPEMPLPIDIVVECSLSFVIVLFTLASFFSGRMKPALRTDVVRQTSWDAMNSRPNYWCFNHRHRPIGEEASTD